MADPEFVANPIDAPLRQPTQAILSGPAILAATSVDEDPEKAARSVQLGRATGVQPSAVQADPERFESQLKAVTAGALVRQNLYLGKYINADPMAASVSNDDWSNLDKISRAGDVFTALHNALTMPWDRAASAGFSAAKEELSKPITQYTPQDVAKLYPSLDPSRPPFGAVANTLATLGLNIGSVIGEAGANIFGAITSGAGAAATAIGGESLGRTVQAMTEYEMIKPWVEAGVEPPKGLSPAVDQAKAKLNAQAVEHMDNWLATVQGSTTKARSPEMFKTFLDQNPGTAHATIGIHGDAVAALYGDKSPAPGDGILGWVPGIGDKLELARTTGADVEVPISGWLASVDPAIAKALHDDIRVWPGGVTAREAGEPTQLNTSIIEQANNLREFEAGGLGEPQRLDMLQHLQSELESMPAAMEIGSPEYAHALDLKQQMLKLASTLPVEQMRAAIGTDTLSIARRVGTDELIAPPPPALSAASVDRPSIEDRLDTIQASGLGLDKRTMDNLKRQLNARFDSDVEASQRRAEREQARRQTAEWKQNRRDLLPEVEASIRQRPDVAVDLFLGSGELHGEKLQQRFTLRADDLTPEQKVTLPAHYVSKNGLPVDGVAREFGYLSGDAMVEKLAQYTALKGELTPQEMLRKVVETETDRQMEARYGNLAENILSEAKDQVLSENDLNLLADEVVGLGMQSGQAGFDKVQATAVAQDMFSKMPQAEVDSNKLFAQMGRHAEIVERALINGDPATAFVAKQRQYLSALLAKEAIKFESERAKFDRVTKYYAKAWDVSKDQRVQADWSVFTRDILSKVGLKYGMSVQGLAEKIERSGFGDLAGFIAKTEATHITSGLEIPVPDWVVQGRVKPVADMTVDEWREVRTAVTAMDRLGREEQKVIRKGEAQDRGAWITQAVKQLAEKFPPLPSERKVGAFDYFAAATTGNETLMSRFDGRDPHGIFTETITYPMAERQNYKNTLRREAAADYRALGPIKDQKKALDSPLIDPRTGKPRPIDRGNLAVIISNMGNNYNWSIFNKGWASDPQAIMAWVEVHSTVEDLERAQALSKIYNGLWRKTQTEYEHIYGVAPESVVPRPFTMHGRQWDGWYHPVVGDEQLSRFVNKMPEPLEAKTNFYPSTRNVYTRKRTGAVQVISLDYDQALLRMDQMIHDIAMRGVVMDTAKIFRDSRFREGIRTYYGKEYQDSMDNWLTRQAGDASFSSGAVAMATRVSNQLRQQVISTAIGFGATTVEKHFSTAAMMSARELSPNLFKSVPRLIRETAEVQASRFGIANRELFAKSGYLGDKIYDFIKSSSEEIQRRERDTLSTLYGVQKTFNDEYTWKEQISHWGSKAVAWSDMISATSLWWAKYKEEMEFNGGVHGDAVRVADLAVRRAHGSTAASNLPMIAAGTGPLSQWVTSLYGFMGTNMQRRIEIIHDVNDWYKLGRQGDIGRAAKMTPAILSSLAVYVVWTGLVEELVSSQFTQDKRGLGAKAATFLFGTVAQTIIGLRDIAYDLKSGNEGVGLFGTPIHHLQHLKRDALEKKDPLGREHAGQLVEDFCSTLGDWKGLCPTPLGRLAHYGLDVFDGFQHPRNLTDVYRGAVSGKQKLRMEK